jgi:lipopolysaccharide export system protein LptA
VDDKGQLPQVVDEQATIQGRRVVVLPDTRNIRASEAVQAIFRPAQKRADGTAVRTPGFFAQDRPAYATADTLDYDGAASRATLRSGNRAKLWQGETTIYGQAIDLDDKTGNLRAKGSVVSTMMLEQTDTKTKRKEKTKTTASADALDYDDAKRRAVYTQSVQLVGAEGNLTTDRATLTLSKEGNGLERLDAGGHIELHLPGTATSGARVVTGETLVYTSADDQYVVLGRPAKYKDQSYETTGDSLTFFRSADRIIVDGVERTRTQAKSGRK